MKYYFSFIVSLFCWQLSMAQVDLNLGLRAYYPFNGNANDVSGNSNNPIFNNATLTTDRFGNANSAYHFNGIDNYMRIPNSPTLNFGNQISICAWVNVQGFYQGPCHGNSIIEKGEGSFVNGHYLLRFDDNFYTSGANCSIPVPDINHQDFYGPYANAAPPGYTPYIQTGQWVSVVYTCDGASANLYVNCELKVSKPVNSISFTNVYDLFLGHLNDPGYPYWFNGDMDEVRFYDRAINFDEVKAISGCGSVANCTNWLEGTGTGSNVTVGDLDIAGNQLTVEATFNRTAPMDANGSYGFLVSKHNGPPNVNYALWPGGCAITTTNGEVIASETCPFELNKTYHVAMVYDGTSLKFYRNGFLMSQIPQTGNLIQNDLLTTIGQNSATGAPIIYPFIGFMNEVRIWNVARTQAQLQTYMNSSLPSPTTQTGLQAYYTFEDLTNKQGNAAWNGTLNGTAAIDATNPNCSFVADSCNVIAPPTNISNIINDYTPVLALDPCNNFLTVEDGTAFNVGDTVLVIQMKGAVIDSTNTATFGNITDYKNCGNYEFNYVKAKTGNIIELKNKLTRQYDIPPGKVQLVRVPYYNSANVTSTLTCLPWDGSKGGVLVLTARDSVTLNANIDVSGKGFRGGKAINSGLLAWQPTCGTQTYFTPNTLTAKQEKGEGVAEVSDQKMSGRGALANGGGGANLTNCGGGGGGNASPGGKGGDQYEQCTVGPATNGGVGGKPLLYSGVQNKIFMGGGGGAGDANDPNGANSFNPDGGNGGAIAIIKTNYLDTRIYSIISNGDSGKLCTLNCKEGMGGGGAGGTILLDANNFLSNPTLITSKGGKGADNSPQFGIYSHGPGGGGSGGVLFIKNPGLPPIITNNIPGGLNGMSQLPVPIAWGSGPGSTGQVVFNLSLTIDTSLFIHNIDSVRIKDSLLSCGGFQFNGLGYTHTTGITDWHWDFGDLGTADTQDPSHTYAANGTYDVHLVGTDINGCKDSITKTVTVNCLASISNIINDYTPVLALNPCNNSITVEDGTAFNAGDTVLIIQMKGAEIDVTNTATFGTITNYHNAGNYEFNIVKAKAGNIIELKNKLTRPYDVPLGKVQLIRVPYYNSVNVSATLTCLPWDGNKGGVLVLHARDTVNLSADLNVNGKGFNGALGFNSNNAVLTCFENDYIYPSTSSIQAALKGESIAVLSNNIVRGKGAPASGGGGGLGHNSGGGGGGNAGAGGFGGYQLDNCGGFPFDNRGIGGHTLTYTTPADKVFLGAGGGAGNEDNPGNPPTSGGNGAGIIIVIADYLKTNTNLIKANGDNGFACDCHDGMGGGGGGGAVLLDVNQYLDNTAVEKKGGNGADMIQPVIIGGRIGPGGGGGGGMLFIKNPSLPAAVTSTNTGGLNGVITQDGNNPYGATAGTDGLNLFNLVVPVDTVLFKPNIDSVRIKDSITSCVGFDFHGLGYTNSTGITGWHWDFGDLSTSDIQDPSHVYAANGTYSVHLVVTDINGCKDSIIKPIIISCPNLISNIINDYTPVLSLDPCDNSLAVEDASQFNIGDTVLLIQMKGALIDSSNTNTFGTVTNYRNAGNYEFNYVLSKTGNVIKFKNKFTRQYDLPDGKVQLIRVPYYTSADVSANLTCLPWDGAKGGVLAFNVRDTLTLNADIDVSDKGFRGGGTGNAFNCGIAEWAFASGTTGYKGEGITNISGTWTEGGGRLANGGGGAFGGNSGAGGGSNLTSGGIGGEEYNFCSSLQAVGGQALTNNLNTKIYLGGGGGGGQNDNGFTIYPGGNGGGIVFISSNHVKGNAFNINANGFSRSEIINDEGGAAGGGGGSVILVANNFINTVGVSATGGAGNSNNNVVFPSDCHGPGAGGSGGVVFVQQGSLSANITTTLTGGSAGLVLNPASICFNTTHGATNGSNGSSLFNFVMNIDTSLFVHNIDSVRFQFGPASSCTNYGFQGFGYTNTSPIVQWDWNFGDGNFGTGQNVTHNYLGTGPYTVHLVGTDINGCKDSVTMPVSLNSFIVNAGNDTAICSNGTVTYTLHGNTTGPGYAWSPAGFLDDFSLQNPTATISTTTMFYLNTVGIGGCLAVDSVLITINPLPALTTINDFSICKLDSMLLTTVSTATTFQWTPPLSVNNPSISSPHFTDTVSQQLIITGTNPATGCFIKDTVNATVKPLPNVLAVPDTSLCGPHPITLTATGAQTYSWSPATGLSNPGIANPVFNGTTTQTYTITGTGSNACVAKDTITITINVQPVISTIVDNAICRGDSIQLLTNTDAETIQWTPAISVSDPTIANPWYHDTVTHQMIVTGTNATGCFVKDTVTITVKPLPNILSIPDTALCGPHNVTLNTNGGQSYSWLPATDLSNPNIGNPVFTGTSTQTYTVTGTGSNACSAKDTVTITVNTVPLVSATSPFTICRNDVLQLASNSNAETTHWSPALSVNNPNISNPNFTDSVSQQMIVTGTNTSTGCFASDTVDVTVKPLPLVNTIRDTTTCTTNTLTLFTTGAQTYSWTPATGLDDPNTQNPVFTGTGVNVFYVTGTGANGCIAIDSVHINITNKPVFNAPENKDICINQSVQLDGNNGTGYQYTWSPGTNLSNSTIVNPVADPPATTIYSLLIYDQVCNYDSTFTVSVIVHPLPVVTAGKSNDMDCSTPQSQLSANGALHYEWIPGTYLSDATISNPIASPYVTTHYIVTGTDLNGCVDTDTVTVIVKGSKYFGFAIPNSFTPNGDNLNDCFGVTYWGETRNFHLMIYNRWGEKVFETRNVSECWDGRYKGNPSEIGNYVYYLTGETLCGKVVRKGNLVLFR